MKIPYKKYDLCIKTHAIKCVKLSLKYTSLIIFITLISSLFTDIEGGLIEGVIRLLKFSPVMYLGMFFVFFVALLFDESTYDEIYKKNNRD